MRDPVPFGRFLLLDRVDVGGMSEVFAARVLHGEGRGRVVAVKRLLPSLAEDPDMVRMFLDEARIAVQLDHPGVARVEELGREGVSYFIALEYVGGRDLKALLDLLGARGERLPVTLAAHVAARVLEALDHAHRCRDPRGRPLGIVHRDVSPRNVLLSFEGAVKLIDFGLARADGLGAMERDGVLRGRTAYLAPEAAAGAAVDRRADVFAAGVVLHEMLTGERLFAGASALEEAERVASAEVRPPHEVRAAVPPALSEAVMWALSRDPDARPAWASDLAAAVAPFAGGAGPEELARYLEERFPDDAARERARCAFPAA
jgi:eukaryotic-like serine/threonine-protein kinase